MDPITLYLFVVIAIGATLVGFVLGVGWTRRQLKKNPEKLAKLVAEAKAARDKLRETLAELGWIEPKA